MEEAETVSAAGEASAISFTDPFVILLVSGILIGLLIVAGIVVAMIVRARAGHNGKILERFLEEEDLRKTITEKDFSNIVKLVENREKKEHERQVASGVLPILRNISGRIAWDVPGIIGVLITITLMAMVLAGQRDNVPDEFYAAWLTVIGYYFGRMQGRPNPEETTPAPPS